VLVDTESLKTLPARELRAGYAEVVKYGLIEDAAFFAWLEEKGAYLLAGDPDLLGQAIRTSCECKARVVAADEREQGRRALLNLGHTFGHAFEAETGYSCELLHGEAVAIGSVMAFDFSVRLGLCPPDDAARVRSHFQSAGLQTDLGAITGRKWQRDALLAHMRRDKKVLDGKMTFILARGIGEAFIANDVAGDQLCEFLDDCLPD
jgi:3-dehydroquinate synthase